MTSRHCQSCAMPLTDESGNYCQYCADAKGQLRSRDEVRQGIAEWLRSWSPPASSEDLQRRADSYMGAMPAWLNR